MLLCIFLIASILFGIQIADHIRVIQNGTPSHRRDHWQCRLRNCLLLAFGNVRVRERWWGWAHMVIFYAFFVFLLESIELIIASVWSGFTLQAFLGPHLTGVIYIIQSYFAALTLTAVSILFIRRIVRRKNLRSTHDAWLILSLIAMLMLSHFGVMAGHLFHGTCASWTERFLPISRWITTFDNINILSTVCGYIHIICVSLFLIWIPRGKHLHIVLAFPSLYGQYRLYDANKKPVTGPDTPDLDKYIETLDQYMENPPENGRIPTLGIAHTDDTTRRMRLEAYACTQCQRCTDACPMVAAHTPNCDGPMQQMIRLRDLLSRHASSDLCHKDENAHRIVTPDEIWSCTQCGACERACAIGVDHTSRIVDLRRALVCEESMPSTLNRVFANVERSGNPWGYARANALPADPAIQDIFAQSIAEWEHTTQTRILVFTGCMAKYDPNMHSMLEKAIQYLHTQNCAIRLIDNETCCGESMRKLGNESGYIACRDQNIEAIRQIPHDCILTICPHCASVLRNDYTTGSERLNVKHIWEFAAENDLETNIPKDGKKRVLHMPCLLGKSPRSPKDLIQLAQKMGINCPEDVTRSHCCGAGGGQFFMDAHKDIVQMRIKEIYKYDADEIVTSCPFCIQMLKDEIARQPSESGKSPNVIHIVDLISSKQIQ